MSAKFNFNTDNISWSKLVGKVETMNPSLWKSTCKWYSSGWMTLVFRPTISQMVCFTFFKSLWKLKSEMNVVVLTNRVKLRYSHISVDSFHWNTADKLGEENCLLTRLFQPVSAGVFTLLHWTNNQQTRFIAPHQRLWSPQRHEWRPLCGTKCGLYPCSLLCCLCFIFIPPPTAPPSPKVKVVVPDWK